MAGTFTPPEYWSFKPFFTLQPVGGTREKQLHCWSSLVLQYCANARQTRLDPTTFELFRNEAIQRRLSPEGVIAVIDHLIRLGNAEWEDASKAWLRIIVKSAESLSGEIYTWAAQNNFIGTVFTVYELHSGEDHQDSGFFGTDPIILHRALGVLERVGKCALFAGSSEDGGDDGVKFL